MGKRQAGKVLAEELERYQEMGYTRLSDMVGEEIVFTVTAPDGNEYQLEIDVLWDNPQKPGEASRVIGLIDDGRFLTAFAPLTQDFLVEPGN